MGVIVDTTGLIYSKLDAINASIESLTTAETSNGKAIAAVQSQLTSLTNEIATLCGTVKPAIAEIAAIYSLLFGLPVTVGVDIKTVVAQLQNIPTKSGP